MTLQTPPLARSVARDVLDWDGVEPQAAPDAEDVLGLRAQDRQALGLGTARTIDLAPTLGGDAHAALAELLQKGVAIGKTEKRR